MEAIEKLKKFNKNFELKAFINFIFYFYNIIMTDYKDIINYINTLVEINNKFISLIINVVFFIQIILIFL